MPNLKGGDCPPGGSDRTSLWGASLAGTIPSGDTTLALGLLATKRDLGFSSSEAPWPLPGRQCCLVVGALAPGLGPSALSQFLLLWNGAGGGFHCHPHQTVV